MSKKCKENFEEVDTIKDVELYECQGNSNDFVNKLKLQNYINIKQLNIEKGIQDLSDTFDGRAIRTFIHTVKRATLNLEIKIRKCVWTVSIFLIYYF